MSQLSKQEQAVWDDHVRAQRSSGQSQKAYCDQHALKHHQFWYFKRKLEGRANLKSKGQSQAKPKPKPERSGFVPVQVAAPVSAQSLSVILANGVTVNGIAEHNQLLAQQLIGALK